MEQQAANYAETVPAGEPFVIEWTALLEQIGKRGFTLMKVQEMELEPDIESALTLTLPPRRGEPGEDGDPNAEPGEDETVDRNIESALTVALSTTKGEQGGGAS